MSREIKFRAWDKDNKMLYRKFAEKDEFTRSERQVAICENGEAVLVDDSDSYGADRSNFIIQQFTGLKDRKGVEIYEGDIVEISYKNSSIKQNAKVVFEKGCFFADLGDRFAYHIYEVADKCEIIGNIYEN